jgi:hypothetical protein
MASEDNSTMDNMDNEKIINEKIERLIPKQTYYNSLDTSVKNMSVTIHESLQKQQQKKGYFRLKVLQIIPLATVASVAILYIVFVQSNAINVSHINYETKQNLGALTSEPSTTEFNAIVNEELRMLNHDYIYQDDALYLFDDMTSSDLQTTVDELVALL